MHLEISLSIRRAKQEAAVRGEQNLSPTAERQSFPKAGSCSLLYCASAAELHLLEGFHAASPLQLCGETTIKAEPWDTFLWEGYYAVSHSGTLTYSHCEFGRERAMSGASGTYA